MCTEYVKNHVSSYYILLINRTVGQIIDYTESVVYRLGIIIFFYCRRGLYYKYDAERGKNHITS